MQKIMRTIIIIILSFSAASAPGYAAEFVRENHSTIRMDGSIAAGDLNRLIKLYDSSVTLVKVQSVGGETGAGMELGRFIHSKKLDLEVAGICASSCANYLFPAARRKYIPRGSVLAFHGTAYTTSLSSPLKMRKMLISAGVLADQVDSQLPDVMAGLERQAVQEREFAEEIGVSRTFYEDFLFVAKAYDRIFPTIEQGSVSVLWWPSSQRLRRCYGIADVHDSARPTVLVQGGRYYEDAYSSMIVGDLDFRGCQL